ncbi:DNA-binding LacI/PurR family transcriptional regulator [Streptosporangium becharense]|uniref:DNA-binding LacI/PurR family transcriptional regulator n=1 Tax=Streptosporangium becharense TaxID=1816182 RepID=A0A7W9MHF5_9ACTN|nr:LacI family DNA-binding transcriptional regulator [Streptosporangium becharense]MBB2914781.1 DNA-binding LacI/PurR family transcriptional regulator [Streptosporangium becharense]MBB5820408.1 DNA-binding LacI/PurR family transcriptional regulator [Streptosporangium becharense]
MTSLRDVAKRAQVAVSTVSAALNGTRPVAAETKTRIERAAAELGYRPNLLARGLVSKRTRILALLFPAPHSGFGLTEMQFATGAAEAAGELGYHLMLSPENTDPVKELRYLTGLGLIDGVLLMEVRLDDERTAFLTEAGVPFSMIGRTRDPGSTSYADIDFARTAQDAVAHVAGLGHRTLAFLNHSSNAYSPQYGPTIRTGEEFAAAARRAGIDYVGGLHADSAQEGRRAFDRLVDERPDVTALAVMNDHAAVGVLAAVAARGWRIPQDLTLMLVLSSARVAEMFHPRLTTLEPPSSELGRLGVRMLIDRLQSGDDTPHQRLVPCRLVVGDSSGPPPATPGERGGRAGGPAGATAGDRTGDRDERTGDLARDRTGDRAGHPARDRTGDETGA